MFTARNRLPSMLKQAHFLRITSVQSSSYVNEKLENAVHRKAGSLSLYYNEQIARFSTQSLQQTKQKEIRELMAVWPDILRDITIISQEWNFPEVTERLRRAMEYNALGGHLKRSLVLLYTYQTLAPIDQITRENLYLARILAWCIEILQGFALMFDDIQDRSLIRRKRRCWYQLEDIGFTAVNDGVMMESIAYYLLRKYFKDKDCYLDLLETYQDVMMKVYVGQSLDLTNFGKTKDFDRFTINLFDNIACYKTAFFTFILPVKLAMLFAGIKNPELFREATEILKKIGNIYQIQDDYLGCYGNREICGKDSTDIEEGKCTWLAVMALQRATPEQRNIFKECYGANDSEKIQRVKKLYNDLDLQRLYFIYERETYNLLKNKIEQLSCELPRELFRKILDDIYRREV